MAFESREYRIFREEERIKGVPTTVYEKACITASKILPLSPPEKTEKNYNEAINFCHLNITAQQAFSFSMLFLLVTAFPTFVLTMANVFGFHLLPFGYGVIFLLLFAMLSYYVYVYPMHLKLKYEMDVGSDIVSMIIYISIYMRNVPNIENAMKFASQHLTGPVAFETRKLLWDVETGKYTNVQEALLDYSKKWEKNKEFVEAIQMIIASVDQATEQRMTMLNESVDVVLEGNRDNARRFNQQLRTPVMVVHAMGVILPILGLVLFPLIAIFLGVGALALFIGYDVILPFVLFLVISKILDKRPSTFSRIDISESPGVPDEKKFIYHGKNMPAWPFAVATAGIFIVLGIVLISFDPEGVVPALFVTAGIAAGFAVYYHLISHQRVSVREKTRIVEDEFTEALFQLGNQVYSGVPVERSLEHSMKRIRNLKIKEFFDIALKNMRTGLTFQQAFFDKNYGAVRAFPSRLIKTIMRIIVESSKRGSRTASVAMLAVSKYLKDLHKTQEDIKEELSETLSSMKFQLYFLSPLIAGIVTTLTVLILRILGEISQQVGGSGINAVPFITDIGKSNITPFQFIIVVGVYLIETCFILSYFINGIENGRDETALHSLLAYSLTLGFVMFTITLAVTMVVFGPLITIVV